MLGTAAQLSPRLEECWGGDLPCIKSPCWCLQAPPSQSELSVFSTFKSLSASAMLLALCLGSSYRARNLSPLLSFLLLLKKHSNIPPQHPLMLWLLKVLYQGRIDYSLGLPLLHLLISLLYMFIYDYFCIRKLHNEIRIRENKLSLMSYEPIATLRWFLNDK